MQEVGFQAEQKQPEHNHQKRRVVGGPAEGYDSEKLRQILLRTSLGNSSSRNLKPKADKSESEKEQCKASYMRKLATAEISCPQQVKNIYQAANSTPASSPQPSSPASSPQSSSPASSPQSSSPASSPQSPSPDSLETTGNVEKFLPLRLRGGAGDSPSPIRETSECRTIDKISDLEPVSFDSSECDNSTESEEFEICEDPQHL